MTFITTIFGLIILVLAFLFMTVLAAGTIFLSKLLITLLGGWIFWILFAVISVGFVALAYWEDED